MDMKKIRILKKYIDECENVVFFGGAGVSTESGIKDFRSKDGLYNQKYKFPPEMILSHSFFISNTLEFFKFYRDKMNCLPYSPNICHKYLSELEKTGKLKAIITQNIDNLHQRAGSKEVLELHGSVFRNYCMKCGKFFKADYIFEGKGVPKCECGGIIKPDVVLYEEELDGEVIKKAINYVENCDMLIIGGTSLTVYPANSFVRFFRGKYLIIINNDATNMDGEADLIINDKIGKVFEEVKKN